MKLGASDVKFGLGSDEVDKICLGDEEVWTNFVPFYWIQDNTVTVGYPDSYSSVTKNNVVDWTVNTTITAMQGYGDTNWAMIGTTTAVSTNGAKYVDIISGSSFDRNSVISVIGIKNNIETVLISGVKPSVVDLDISGYDAIKLQTTCSAYATNWAYAYIKTIYFHK